MDTSLLQLDYDFMYATVDIGNGNITEHQLTEVNIVQVSVELCAVSSLQSSAEAKVTQLDVAL